MCAARPSMTQVAYGCALVLRISVVYPAICMAAAPACALHCSVNMYVHIAGRGACHRGHWRLCDQVCTLCKLCLVGVVISVSLLQGGSNWQMLRVVPLQL